MHPLMQDHVPPSYKHLFPEVPRGGVTNQIHNKLVMCLGVLWPVTLLSAL